MSGGVRRARLLGAVLVLAACGDGGSAGGAGKGGSLEGDIKAGAGKAASRPELDAAAARTSVEALATVSAEQRSMLASRALLEIEGGRLPAPALKVLESLPSFEPSTVGAAIAKALAEPQMLQALESACAGKGAQTMRNLAMTEPPDKSSGAYTACGFARIGLMTAEEAAATEPMPMTLAHVLAWHLEEGGGASTEERELLRALAGLPVR